MNKLTLAQVLCALTVGIAGSATAGSIGASFLGRNDITSLAPTETAGLVEQAFWNNIDDGNAPSFTGTSVPLQDDAGNLTAVTVSFKGNDSWNSNGPHDTANDRLMLGIIKQGGGQHHRTVQCQQPGCRTLRCDPLFGHGRGRRHGRNVRQRHETTRH